MRKNSLARFNPYHNALSPQPTPTLPFMNFGVNVQRGKQRVERAGRSMEHKGIIQPLMRAKTRLSADMVIFFMDLRRL